MEIVVHVSLRKDRGQRAEPLRDIRIDNVYAKMPEEVLQELMDKLETAVNQAYYVLGQIDELDED